jgi:hypothetical protein
MRFVAEEMPGLSRAGIAFRLNFNNFKGRCASVGSSGVEENIHRTKLPIFNKHFK